MTRALVLTLLALGTPALANAQISPGPLARRHQRFEGTLQCVKCHAGGRGGGKEQMTGLCLSCHKEIAWLVERGRGLHGAAPVKAQRCASCHPDHAGVDFELITWEGQGGSVERFDHARAGWPLEQSHGRQRCTACHKTTFRISPVVRFSERPAVDSGWLGLERTCTACHQDAHRGALAPKCLTCHDVERWKPAPRFDHAQTDYPLTGAHGTVKCAACHESASLQLASTSTGVPIPRFRPLEHRECSACHTDVHRGQFGGACSRCHQTTSFTTIHRGSFDHNRTRYPLRGRHTQVACEKCHDFAAGQVARNPAFATCNACHSPDPHAGSATLAGRVVDCASCHAVEGWRPTAFTVAQHQRTRYPLEGRHAQARCAGCHVKSPNGVPAASLGSAGVWMRPATATCVSCHVDPHAARYATCVNCHDAGGFRPATIDVAAHQRFGFTLEGAHRAVPCSSCHDEMRRPMAPSTLTLARWTGPPLLFAGVKGGCAGCHQNPHGTQFANGSNGAACENCHDAEVFRPARRFNHDRDAAFSLKGAHANVPCDRCHKPSRGARGKPMIVYRGVPSACEACH